MTKNLDGALPAPFIWTKEDKRQKNSIFSHDTCIILLLDGVYHLVDLLYSN